MNPEHEQRVEALFHAALQQDPAGRGAWLQSACAGDHELHAAVQSLLQHHDQPTPSGLTMQVVRPEAEPTLPAWIDRYRLVERIGEGGMGVVYLAEQAEPVQRRVALKVMRAGLDTDQALRRFAAERQALARMDHPNISRIHDAGATAAGRPYYVMEYTPGPGLTVWCDEHRLDIDARLRLFLTVCDAVQHAHQRGVIHRDLKPGNVLVTDISGTPLPKVIDFGIARPALVDAPGTRGTRAGDVLGTFDYMSPEQALGDDVDTRTDIWSLGVILYELLTGVLPFAAERLRQRSLADVQRFLQQAEPTRPSTSIAHAGDGAAAAATLRATEPAALRRRLRTDLDWIVLKALARDREHRYASASELAADLRRHLDLEPVLAGPPSARYRFGKFVRRHRGAVGAAVAVLLALALGLVGTVAALTQAQRAEQREGARAEALRRQLYATNVTLAQTAIDRGDAPAARRLLEQCPEDLRGFEWRYLYGIHDQSKVTLRLEPDDFGANCGVWLAGGDHLLLGLNSGKLARVDVARGVVTTRQPLFDNPIVALSTDAARERLLVGSETGTWLLLDARTLTPLRTIASPLDEARRIALAPDGRRVAILRGDQSLQLLDLDRDERTACARPSRAVEFQQLAFHPDGQHVVAAGADLCVWNLAGERTHDLPEPRRQWRSDEHPELQPRVQTLQFDATGRQLALGIGHAPATADGTGNRVELRDTGSYGVEQVVSVPGRGTLSALAFAPDGLQLVAGCGRELVLTSLGGSWRQHRIAGPATDVAAITFRDDGQSFVTFGNDGLQVWPRHPMPTPDSLELTPPFGRIVWSADRRALAVSTWALGGSVVFDTETFELLRAFLPPHGPTRVLAFGPGPGHVIATGTDGGLGVYRLADAAAVRLFAAARPVLVGRLDADGSGFVGADADGRLGRFDVASGRMVAGDDTVGGGVLELLPTGRNGELAVVREHGGVEIRDAATLAPRQQLTLGVPLAAAALDTHHARLFAIDTDGTLLSLSLRTAAAPTRLGELRSSGFAIDVGDDGRRLVVLDGDHAQIRDSDDGRVLLPRLLGGPAAATAVFRPDGRGVLTAGQRLGAWEHGTPESVVAARAAAIRGRDAFLRLKVRHGTNAAIAAHAGAEVLDAPARAALERTLARCPDSPFELNHEAWFRVLRPYLAPEQYRFAVIAADTAVALLPRRELRNTLATACLRAGDLARAARIAGELLAEARAAGREPHPVDLAVLTMAQARLGDTAAARATMATLRELTRDPSHVQDPQSWIFIREAEATLADR